MAEATSLHKSKNKNLPSMSTFPRTLADLKAGEFPFLSEQSFYSSLKQLHKSTLSIPNRLRSIQKDAEFVREVAAAYQLPVIANERCGSWYVPPDIKAGSAYFKSTDGHTGQWSFSLRRLNLQVLGIVGQSGGCVVVDSTRRGKVMPDAFAKTVPIWCAVLNRALFPEVQEAHHFQVPGVELPASEVAQIESRLGGFVREFQDLGIDCKALRGRLGRPMRLQWVIGHSTNALLADRQNDEPRDTLFHDIILCSASRRVQGAEMSEGGYVQGAGDDSEGWAQGITPQVFWNQSYMLFQVQEDELPDLIKKLVMEEEQRYRPLSAVLVKPTNNLYIGSWQGHEQSFDPDLLINCHSSLGDKDIGGRKLNLNCESGKVGSRDLRHKLHEVKSCVGSILERNLTSRILITCETGRDLSVGVALLLICSFYASDGKCVLDSTGSPCSLQPEQKIDKGFIRQRLAWITSSKPDANPSRSTLQSVNAYLMNKP